MPVWAPSICCWHLPQAHSATGAPLGGEEKEENEDCGGWEGRRGGGTAGTAEWGGEALAGTRRKKDLHSYSQSAAPVGFLKRKASPGHPLLPPAPSPSSLDWTPAVPAVGSLRPEKSGRPGPIREAPDTSVCCFAFLASSRNLALWKFSPSPSLLQITDQELNIYVQPKSEIRFQSTRLPLPRVGTHSRCSIKVHSPQRPAPLFPPDPRNANSLQRDSSSELAPSPGSDNCLRSQPI